MSELGTALPHAGQYSVDLRVATAALMLSMCAGCVFGLVPSVMAGRPRLVAALVSGGRVVTGSMRHSLRRGFVVAQAALALLLVVGAGLTVRTFKNMVTADPGLDADNVLAVELSLPVPKYFDTPLRLNFCDQLLERVRAMPGVRSAARTQMLPFEGRGWQPKFHVEGHPAEAQGHAPMAEGSSISADYFRTMGIPLLAGRDFGSQDGPDAPGVVIIDEKIAASFWPDRDPVGKLLKLGSHDSDRPWLKVVGVVGHLKLKGVHREARWQLYVPESQEDTLRHFLVVKTEGNPRLLVEPIRQAVLDLDPEQPLVIRQAMRPVALGTILGLAIAAMLSRVARGLFYDISPLDPPTYLGAVLLLLVVAMVASWLPARRVTTVDPIITLRAE